MEVICRKEASMEEDIEGYALFGGWLLFDWNSTCPAFSMGRDGCVSRIVVANSSSSADFLSWSVFQDNPHSLMWGRHRCLQTSQSSQWARGNFSTLGCPANFPQTGPLWQKLEL
ncbi:hypothetical protein AVEN_127524-1 [Araneus ventricosus]|uniref:Uncharacterized protein n=1 Tax=Araneus ventricosus TaxID=182803 RepID=A0A4Y2MHW3_ARAVE|nr:hypothetical protein AVEN_127524-1 [Araneus ventricosus]